MSAAASTLSRAHADALLLLIRDYYGGRLRLDRGVYWALGERGMERTDVAAAVDQLVQDGRATVEVERGVVVMRLAP